MAHTVSSTRFRQECALLPHHTMHVMARYKVTAYMQARYLSFPRHTRRLALALERMDQRNAT